jgi:lysophospholipase L1-like esterase
MAKAQEIVALLQQMNRKPAPVVRVRTAPGKIYGKIPERPRPAPRATQFSELVQQLSARGT